MMFETPDIQSINSRDISILKERLDKVASRLDEIEDCARKGDRVIVPLADISSMLSEFSALRDDLEEHRRFVEHVILCLTFPDRPIYCLEFNDDYLYLASNLLDKMLKKMREKAE